MSFLRRSSSKEPKERKKSFAELSATVSQPRVVLLDVNLRNISLSVESESFTADFYVSLTWREPATNAALLDFCRKGGGSVEYTSGGTDPLAIAIEACFPACELMNSTDVDCGGGLKEFHAHNAATVLVFDKSTKWADAATYVSKEASTKETEAGDAEGTDLVPIRTVHHVKGTFSLEHVNDNLKDFPFDQHVLNVVLEAWDEADSLTFLSPALSVGLNLANHSQTLVDNTSGKSLFPIASWDLVRGKPHTLLEEGICVWTFTRRYVLST